MGTCVDERAMEQVREYMRLIAQHPFTGTETGMVLQDALSVSGKMIRPKLLLWCAAFGPKAEEHARQLYLLSAMVELTHLSSLIHDDIIDEAPFRRGMPSIQGKYGKDAAVYAGDFLITRVHQWQVKERLFEGAILLSEAVEKMCAGEVGQALHRYDTEVTEEIYLSNIKGKTASLFSVACGLGGMEAGCSGETVEKLKQFGEYLGILFQLRDDLLDFTSDQRKEGKEVHKDFRDGIYTFPVLMALKSEEGRKVLLPIMEDNRTRKLEGRELAYMEHCVKKYGGLEMTVRQIHTYADQARVLLDTLIADIFVEEASVDFACFEKKKEIQMLRRLLENPFKNVKNA